MASCKYHSGGQTEMMSILTSISCIHYHHKQSGEEYNTYLHSEVLMCWIVDVYHIIDKLVFGTKSVLLTIFIHGDVEKSVVKLITIMKCLKEKKITGFYFDTYFVETIIR